LDGPLQVAAHAGRGDLQVANRVGDAPLHVHARAFGGPPGPPVSPAQADGARQLGREEVELPARALRASGVVPGVSLLQLPAQVGEAAAVGVARLRIELDAGVARIDGSVAAGEL